MTPPTDEDETIGALVVVPLVPSVTDPPTGAVDVICAVDVIDAVDVIGGTGVDPK